MAPEEQYPNLVASLLAALPAELGGTWTISAAEGQHHGQPFVGIEVARENVPWCRRSALIDGDRDDDPAWVEAITWDLTERFRYAIARTN